MIRYQVQPALKIISAEVTGQDIRDGVPGNPGSCPVAIAVRRATGYADILAGFVMIHAGGYSAFTPPHLAAWMRAYDAAPKEVSALMPPPPAFELELRSD